MPSEMLSGPDLGGGFLHQLSIDREGERTTFTYHAQDGGQDAGGPAKGPLDVLGFVHPDNPCQFGGPSCWHRRFLLPFAETPRVRQTYNRFRFVLEAMIAQAYEGRAVPFDTALSEVVRRLRAPLAETGVDWYVGGSGAARLLGAEVSPRDIDLGTTREGVDRIGGLFAELLIEPAAPTDWPGAGLVRAGRAFVGTFRDGARVEWAVPLEPGPPAAWGEWTGVAGAAKTLEVPYPGGPLRVSRPEYAFVRSAEKNRGTADPAIAALIRRVGPDAELLDVLLKRARLAPAVEASVREVVRR